ncbi:MAG: response regulator [Deltaproteobacteria bacterium]|nr:response regulator [Deltaproteobacteria bacterium]MBW1796511.1 response regulator [Deltaproteobacteria bacterium]MBW2331517.1 response regulator [Deltaproteobacteria bacterium]
MPTVLIAKDSEDVCFMISETLKHYVGCNAIAAANGSECFRMARDEAPDVILLDIYIPGMEGFEAYERLRNDEETRSIPTIFMAHHRDDLKRKIESPFDCGLRIADCGLGVDVEVYDYLIEPFHTLELIARVKVMLRLKELIDEVERHSRSANNEYWQLQAARINERLRTYLLPIMGFAALLLKTEQYGPLTEKQKEFINVICKNGEKILQINLLNSDTT